MKSEVMYEGIDMNTATERVQGILHGKGPGQLDEFKLPQVPAAVQQAGDNSFADLAKQAGYRHQISIDAGPGDDGTRSIYDKPKRAPRSDKGKTRTKPVPQPAPVPEQKAVGITQEQQTHLRYLISKVIESRLAREDAEENLTDFIDSLAVK